MYRESTMKKLEKYLENTGKVFKILGKHWESTLKIPKSMVKDWESIGKALLINLEITLNL